MSPSVRVQVPAKINLGLSVGPRRRDGYHSLATVYQAVSLYDYVEIEDRSDGGGPRLTVAGREAAGVPDDRHNLAWQAVERIAAAFGREPDVTISIDKGIPVAGGMAGGSADAAGALLACAELWTPLGEEIPLDVAALGAQLGSDVPFPLVGGTAVGTGRGEVITSAITRGSFHWVLALSDRQLATPYVYQTIDSLRGDSAVGAPQISSDILLAVRQGDPQALGAALSNDLQPAVFALIPELAVLLDLGPEHGALGSVVSGSGPTCAFLVADEDAALELAVALSASGLCRAVRRAVGPVPGACVIPAS